MKNITVEAGRACGTVTVPASKSLSIRALLLAGITEGESRLFGLSDCEDVRFAMGAIRELGARINPTDNGTSVVGINPKNRSGVTLHVGESATLLRLILPILALSDAPATVCMQGSLVSRGIEDYQPVFAEHSVRITAEGDRIHLCGRLSAGDYQISAEKSSQYASGLLLALPFLDGTSKLTLTEKTVSRSYLNLTEEMLDRYGVSIKKTGQNTFEIEGNQIPKPIRYTVEGDFSSAVFIDAFNYLGGDVHLSGLPECSKQGDAVYRTYFRAITEGTPTVDLTDCPDLAPMLFTLACLKNGAVFEGVARLKNKESSRATVMAEELSKFGLSLVVDGDRAQAFPAKPKRTILPLDSHGDHRIAMALSILLTQTGGSLTNAACVAKSYPDFYRMLSSIGITVNEMIEDK